MKTLDVLGTGVKAAARAIVAAVAPRRPPSPDALEEQRRRGRVNAEAAAARAERERELFGASGRWLGRRSDWLSRRL